MSFIFCCFQSNDHPEITYRLREDFVLQTMEPTLPIPSYDELDCMFSELVVSVMYSNAYLHSDTHDLFIIIITSHNHNSIMGLVLMARISVCQV